MGDLNIIQKRIFELPQTFTPVGAEEYSNKYIAVDQNGWEEAQKMSLAALISAALGTTGNLVESVELLLKLASNSGRAANETVNTGINAITFTPAFDGDYVTGVQVIAEVRRVSDNAVIDYVITDKTLTGFNIEVWDDNVTVSYVATPTGFGAGTSIEPTTAINAGIQACTAGTNYIAIPLQVTANYNPRCIAYDSNGDEVAVQIVWSNIDEEYFEIYVAQACTVRWETIIHTS
jgi:hypothetical protein